MADVAHQINAVRRRLGTRTVEAGEVRVVTMSQVYDTDVDDLWDACTNRERLPRWFAPVTGELRLGGRYQVENNAGGTIETCDPPKSFSATWEYDGDVSWIEVRLTAESGGGARFELDHVVPVNDHWEKYGPGAVGVGWDLAFHGLALHLTSGASVDPAEAMAWMVSDEGKRFVTLASESWHEAALAAGEDPAVARRWADRVSTFFRGEEEPA